MSLLGKPIEDVIETLYKSIKSKRQIITDIKKEYNVDNDSFNDIKINRFKLIELLDEFEVTISQSLQAIQTFKVEIFNLKEKQSTEEILNLTNEFQMKFNLNENTNLTNNNNILDKFEYSKTENSNEPKNEKIVNNNILINNNIIDDNKENELFNNDEDIDDEELIENGLHNLCFNLKNNDFTFEPLYERVTKIQMGINNLIPEKISRWCKISEEGNKTIKEFNQTIKNKYGINVTLILSGEDDRDIYTKLNSKSKDKKIIEKRLEMEEISNKKLEDAYFQTAQKICKEYDRKNEIFLKVKGFTDKGNYVELPVIKIQNEVIPIKN